MSIDAKRLIRLLVMQALALLLIVVVMFCSGCATIGGDVPDTLTYVPGHWVCRTDGYTIRQIGKREDAAACYIDLINTVYVNKYFPDRNRDHEDWHVAGYRHGANWPQDEDEPRDKAIKE